MNPTGLTPAWLPKAPRLPGRQRGITLIIALIALVALTMAGIALVRSVDTGNVIAGRIDSDHSVVRGNIKGGKTFGDRRFAGKLRGMDLRFGRFQVGPVSRGEVDGLLECEIF